MMVFCRAKPFDKLVDIGFAEQCILYIHVFLANLPKPSMQDCYIRNEM